VGQVSFHSDKHVKRVRVETRQNPIVNRLNKTKNEIEVDHEQERVDRIKAENAVKRAAALAKRKADTELALARAKEKAERSYDSLFSGQVEVEDADEDEDKPKKTVRELEEDFM